MMVECPKCRGHGFVMTCDPGIAGAEEYGTCPLCHGVCMVDESYGNSPALRRRIEKLETKLCEIKESE